MNKKSLLSSASRSGNALRIGARIICTAFLALAFIIYPAQTGHAVSPARLPVTTSAASGPQADLEPASTPSRAAGGVWETVSSPTTNSLYALDFSSPTSGWAGGDKVLLRYDGASWQIFSIPGLGTDYRIYAISMISDTDGWLVGSAIRSHPYYDTVVFQWDGSQWNEVTSPTQFALFSVSAADASHVFTVGGGTLCNPSCTDLMSWGYLWNGNQWVPTPIGSHRRVSDLSMAASNEGWMVGDEVNTSTGIYKPLALRWVNGNWQSVSVPDIFNNRLYAVSTLDANRAWAIGMFDTLMWDGSAWSVVPNQTTRGLRDVLAVASNDAWVVGEGGTILHWDGSSFVTSSSPATVVLSKVANSSPSDIWVVGMSGTILHYATPTPSASLSINYTNGAPGSFFTLTGANFPPGSMATITVNGQEVGTVPVDSSGVFVFLLNTDQAGEGLYVVTATVNPRASATFVLDSDEPTRAQEGSGMIFTVPAGVAYTHVVYLPLVNK